MYMFLYTQFNSNEKKNTFSIVCVQQSILFEQWAREQICMDYAIFYNFGLTQKKSVASKS